MAEFNSFMKKGEVSLKTFKGAKARQLNHYTTPPLEDNTYDAAAIHVGIKALLNKHIIYIGLRCKNNNISMIFISSIAHSSNINPESM